MKLGRVGVMAVKAFVFLSLERVADGGGTNL
jgi:hypothetical protein